MPAGRVEGALHGERPRVPVPPGDRALERRLVLAPDVDERRRAGAAVEVLVSAAHGQVGAVVVQPDVDHARRVAEVPADQRADLVGDAGQLGQVPELAGAVVDRRVRDQGDVGSDLAQPGRDLGGAYPLDGQPREASGSVEDVEVGGERVGVGQDDPPLRAHPGGGDEDLEEVDRGGVGDDHLTRRGADQSADPVADPLRRAPPVGLVPRPDQPVAPLPLGDVGQGGGHGAGERAQRVAVEVHQVVREGEELPPVCVGVLDVEIGGAPGQVVGDVHPRTLSDPGDATRRSPTTPHVMTSFPTFRSEGVDTSSRAEKQPGHGRGSHGLGRPPDDVSAHRGR